MNTRPRLWTKAFLLLCFAHLMVNVAFHACLPAFPLLLQDRFLLKGIAMGVAVAGYTVSAILTRPPTGYCLDRFGRRVVYLPGSLLFGLIYLGYPMAEGAVAVTLVRFLHGALWGVAMGAAATVAVDLLPRERRGEGIGYFGFSMIFGMALGPAVGVYCIEHYGYDVLFHGATGLSLAGFAVVCCLPFPDIPRNRRKLTLGALLEKSSLPASLATLIFCVPFAAIMNFSAVFARNVEGASAGLFYLFLALGTALTRLFSGRIFDRAGPAGIMALGYGLLMSGCLLLSLAGYSPAQANWLYAAWREAGRVLFVAGGLFMGLGYGIAIPVIQAMINALVPAERRGAANATMMAAFDLGICLGLLGISHVQEAFGWSVTYAGLFCCVGVSALVFRCLALPRYRRSIARLRRETDGLRSRGTRGE